MILMSWYKEPDVLFVVETPVTITKRQESSVLHDRHAADLEIIAALPYLLSQLGRGCS